MTGLAEWLWGGPLVEHALEEPQVEHFPSDLMRELLDRFGPSARRVWTLDDLVEFVTWSISLPRDRFVLLVRLTAGIAPDGSLPGWWDAAAEG